MATTIDSAANSIVPPAYGVGYHPTLAKTWVRPHDRVLVATLAMCLLLWAATGVPITPFRPWFAVHCIQITFLLLVGLAGMVSLRFARHLGRRRRVTARYLRALLSRHFGGAAAWTAVRCVVVLVLIVTVHTSIKQAIPLINPAQYDTELIAIERVIHFGLNPAWDLARSDPPEWWTEVLDTSYYLWFAFMPLAGAYFLSHRNRRKRDHYFAAFMYVWPVGVLLGLAFPSHGPCYTDTAQFPASGMSLCRMVQGKLWEHYTGLERITLLGDGGLQFGCGLMALPSLHVTVCCLYVLFFWHEGLWLRWGSIVYAGLIFVGSLYSGWHYAIDAYAGLAIAALATWAAGRLPGAARQPVGRCIIAQSGAARTL